MRLMNLAIVVFSVLTLLVAILSPRIPPFFGYFLCRLGHDLQILGDPCQLVEDLNIQNLISYRINDFKVWIGILSGFVCFAVYIPGHYNIHQMTTHEILPSLLFQKDCLFQFQEEITHANFKDCNKTMMKYRQLQLLNIMFNNIYGKYYFGILIVGIIMAMIPTGYLLITSYHMNEIVLSFVVFITVTEYVVMTTIFMMASQVWNASVKFRYAWKKNIRLSSRPLTRRYGGSLQNLRIQIGASNFVETNTPFVFVSFCVEQTINLVLLNKA
jgi:hypothetical protein